MRVTAFVTTVGAQTFEECMTALDAQRPDCRFDVISHCTPFAAAANEMVRRCETELFVQVDEDMILEPDAIERLVAFIDQQPPNVVMATLPLWDEDLEMVIFGVKIYRHALIKDIPFVHHVLGDIHDRAVWESRGLAVAKSPRTLAWAIGKHGTFYTPEQSFQRWRALWQRHRRTGRLTWIESWLHKLAQRYRRSGTTHDLYALAGALIGSTEPLWPDDAGPDASRPDAALAELLVRLPVRKG